MTEGCKVSRFCASRFVQSASMCKSILYVAEDKKVMVSVSGFQSSGNKLNKSGWCCYLMWVYVGAYYLICTSRDLFSILTSAAERWVASDRRVGEGCMRRWAQLWGRECACGEWGPAQADPEGEVYVSRRSAGCGD